MWSCSWNHVSRQQQLLQCRHGQSILWGVSRTTTCESPWTVEFQLVDITGGFVNDVLSMDRRYSDYTVTFQSWIAPVGVLLLIDEDSGETIPTRFSPMAPTLH